MFSDLFYLLREYRVPVSFNEWMAFMEALDQGLGNGSLTGFYYLARAVLIKSEAYYDRFDLAFSHYFDGIETVEGLPEKVWEWLNKNLPEVPAGTRLPENWRQFDLEELKRELEKRLREQNEEHHGGSYWIGTGGTSPFGHSGNHPGGMRIGGDSRNLSAVKVAGERRYQEFRTDETLGVRQFQMALRKLRQFNSQFFGEKTELDLDETVKETCHSAGRLQLVWNRPRRNMVKVLLLMDSGGSMRYYSRLCNQLFTAVNRANHFKDLQIYYFHNCVYDNLFLDPYCSLKNSVKTEHILHTLDSNYRLLLVGDASMGPSELMTVGGIIEWDQHNEEPGITWLQRLRDHYEYSVWLNPIQADRWSMAYGAYSIRMIREVFPMFELTLDGLEQAIRRLHSRIA
ncbi:MAG: VWA domain-containing protein [Firmicutes bacterium]|nr:VWA domain-containing protein [Bacillota bacterium]